MERSLRFIAPLGAGLLVLATPALRAQDSETSASLDTVIVTAQKIQKDLELERALTPGSVTMVDGDAQFERSVTNMADLLRYVPGVWSESASGSDHVTLSSRGSNLDATDYDMNGVKLLQDGLPVTTADGNNHNRMLDPLSARYATIAHGANALTYGASTLGGAIDFTSPTARSADPLSLFATGGSHGQMNGRLTGGFAGETLDGLATVEVKNWDGYRDHSRQESSGVYANGGWRVSDDVTLRLFVTALESDGQLPGALTRAEVEEDPDQAAPTALGADAQIDVDTRRVAAKTTWAINDRSSLDFGLSYEEQSLYHPIVDRILVDFDGEGPNPPVEVFSLLVDTDQNNAGANMRYRLEAGDHQLLLGVNYGDTTNQGGNYRNLHGERNGLRESVDNSADSLEVFAVDRWSFSPDWTVVYGAQFVDASRQVRVVNANTGALRNPGDDYSSVNPRLGLIHSFSENNEFFASASRLFEAPTNYELEDDARGNNSTLDPMNGNVLEVGFRGHSDSADNVIWRWDVAAYYARIRDEILSVDDPAASGNSLTTNVDRTTHAGLEAMLGASFAVGGRARIEPLLSLTYNDFSFDSDPNYGDNRLPAAPRYVARGEILYRNGGLYVGPTFDFVGKRFADFANSYEVGSHELLGLRGGYTTDRWEFFAEVRNLLDEEYIATVSVMNEAGEDARVLSPGAPLSAYAGVRMRL